MEISDFIEEKMAAARMPGMGIAILVEDGPQYVGYHGWANLEHRVPVGPETVWEIASVTKPFTAQAVMLAVEAGLLQLTDRLTQHVEGLPDHWKDIEIRHCLTHQSGIPSYTNAARYWELAGKDKTVGEVLDLVRDLPLLAAPGERHHYDNSGYYLLGLVLESVYNQPFGDLIQNLICKPLGLQSTVAVDYKLVIPHRAAGYQVRDGSVINKPYYSPSNTFSAGCLLSTIPDLIRWQAALTTDQLLSNESRELMVSPHLSRARNEREHHFSLGLGWFLVDHPLGQFVGHNGSIMGYASTFIYFPERKITVIGLCNQGDIVSPHQLPLEVVEAYFI